jgi:hypothetical protein
LFSEGEKMYEQIQPMIDANPYVSGRANSGNVIESDLYVLYASAEGLKHISDRHADEYAPGSLFSEGLNLADELKKIIQSPGEGPDGRGMVKWLEKDAGKVIGFMGVDQAEPDKVATMKDYIMPGGRMEKVKVAAGERKPTSVLNVITAKIGSLTDGRPVLSLVTMFPGTNTINGVDMPFDRSAFAASGFYFVLPADSPML